MPHSSKQGPTRGLSVVFRSLSGPIAAASPFIGLRFRHINNSSDEAALFFDARAEVSLAFAVSTLAFTSTANWFNAGITFWFRSTLTIFFCFQTVEGQHVKPFPDRRPDVRRFLSLESGKSWEAALLPLLQPLYVNVHVDLHSARQPVAFQSFRSLKPAPDRQRLIEPIPSLSSPSQSAGRPHIRRGFPTLSSRDGCRYNRQAGSPCAWRWPA